MGRAIGTGPRYAPVIKPDTRVESWRRSSDRHNRRRHEHPRPPAATPQHTGHQLTGILLAAMIAGAHIAEARANIQSSSHRSANRRESDSGTEPARNATARASLRAALPPATLPQAGSRTALAAVPARDFQDAGGARQARSAAASLSPLAQSHHPKRLKLNGDLPLDRSSLIGSRVMAIGKLLGSAAENKEDEQLLEIANTIHRRAADNPNDSEAVEASKVLFREEGLIWARENGADLVGMGEEDALKIFREAWDLALNPPPAPVFKSRSQIMSEIESGRKVIRGENAERELIRAYLDYLSRTGDRDKRPEDLFITENDLEKVSRRIYYKQFYDYTKTNLRSFCTARTLETAASAGLERLLMEYRPRSAWIIKGFSYRRRGIPIRELLGAGSGIRMTHKVKLKTPALVLQLPDGSYGFIPPSGDFQRLPRNSVDTNGMIDSGAILRAFRIDALRGRSAPTLRNIFLKKRIPDDQFKISMKYVTAEGDTASIRDIMESKICGNILNEIEAWKEKNYDPAATELILDTLIPFSGVLKKVQDDPGYTFKIEDVVGDLLSLGLTIAIAGGAALVRASARTALATGTGALSSSAALCRMLESGKTSAYLIEAGRELTSFVVPPYSAKNLALAGTRARTSTAKEILLRALHQSDELLAVGAKSGGDTLDAIYKSLARNWWGGKQTPELIRAEIDARAAAPIPAVLFRGQKSTEITSSWGVVGKDRLDDYLAAIIKHSARAGGSAGETFSLTTDKSVALRFIKHRDQGHVLAISTVNDPENFRTIEHILKYDGPRLVKENKITRGTLAAAIRYALEEGEKEVFYLGGSIPSGWVEVAV